MLTGEQELEIGKRMQAMAKEYGLPGAFVLILPDHDAHAVAIITNAPCRDDLRDVLKFAIGCVSADSTEYDLLRVPGQRLDG